MYSEPNRVEKKERVGWEDWERGKIEGWAFTAIMERHFALSSLSKEVTGILESIGSAVPRLGGKCNESNAVSNFRCHHY